MRCNNHATTCGASVLLLTATAVLGLLVSGPGAFCEKVNMAALEKLDPASAQKADDGALLWYDGVALGVEGKGWADVEHPYHRLPAKAEGVVRAAVWSLSTRSAGVCIRFVTDAESIAVRWTLTSNSLAMNHMPATGVSGVDLYVNDAGTWRWIGVGRPEKAPTNEKTLASGIPEGPYEFLLYLPLYNGTQSVQLGIPPEAALAKAPPYPPERAKPILFYGTSIVQGGCASRPGMVHTSILSRRLHCPAINLGFSGNGTMDPEFGELIAEVDAAAYVLDCLPNMRAEMVTERVEPFVKALRKARPETPIVLVENIVYQAGYFLPATREAYEVKNRALRAAYERLLADGVPGLHYVPGASLLGNDGEGAVDGTHATDLGFQRFADALEPVLRSLLE